MTRYAPHWIQAGSYSAAVDRRLIGAIWPSGGVLGMAVTPSSALTLSVAPGAAAVPTPNNTGSTLCTSDFTELVGPLAAAPASGTNRIDLIIVRPRANDIDGGTNNDWIFDFVTGVPAASPVAPAAPSGTLAIAQIAVAGGTAAIVAANITNLRPPIAPLSHPYLARIYRQAAINGNGGGLRMPYDQISYDPSNSISGLGALPVYNPPVPGRYLVTARGGVGGPTVQTRVFVSVFKNGVEAARGGDQYAPASVPACAVVCDVVPAGPGDQLWVQVFQQTSNGFDVGTALNYATFALQTWP
jgi:hypothetical protein